MITEQRLYELLMKQSDELYVGLPDTGDKVCKVDGWLDLARLAGSLNQDIRNETGRAVVIEHDGFAGTIIGGYVTREGKRGYVVQQGGTRVVHVYGAKWVDK
jgi:hypothetical protein